MKKTTITVLLFLMILIAGCSTSENTDHSVSIGVLLPLTTNTAAYGEDARQGIMLALEDKPVDLAANIFVEDHQADPKLALAAYEKLGAQTKLDAVISAMSPVSLALQPRLNEQHVIQMAVFSSTPDYSSIGDYSFRT